MYNNTGLSGTGLLGAGNTTITTPAGSANFSVVTSANIAQIQFTVGSVNAGGKITGGLSLGGIATVAGTFTVSEQAVGTSVTQILIGATNVTAFVGTTDGSYGVEISGGVLGMMVTTNTKSNATSYALNASGNLSLVGFTQSSLGTGVTLTATASLQINTTGAAENQTIQTSGGAVQLNYTDGTNGTADQRYLKVFSGSVALSIGGFLNLSGDFTLTIPPPSNGINQILIGASNVTLSANDGSDPVASVTNGSLGLIISQSASTTTFAVQATGTATLAGAISATATVFYTTSTTAVTNVKVAAGSSFVLMNVAAAPSASIPYEHVALDSGSVTIPGTNFTISIDGSGNVSSSSTGIVLGSVLQLDGLAFSGQIPNFATFKTTNGATGTITATITSATLFPNQGFSANLTGATISFTFTSNGSGGFSSYAVKVTASASLAIGQAFVINLNQVQFSYDTSKVQTLANGSNPIFAITSVQITSPQFGVTGTVTGLKIFSDGFLFNSASISASNIKLGGILSATGISLAFGSPASVAFSVTFGSSPVLTASSMVMTISGLQLFPGGFLTTSLNPNGSNPGTASVTFDFSSFNTANGASAGGAFNISIPSGITVKMGEAFQLTTGAISITPGQAVIAQINSAALSFPSFSGLGVLTVNNLQITQTGFNLGSLTLQSQANSLPGIGSFLSFDSLTVSLNSFSYSNVTSFTETAVAVNGSSKPSDITLTHEVAPGTQIAVTVTTTSNSVVTIDPGQYTIINGKVHFLSNITTTGSLVVKYVVDPTENSGLARTTNVSGSINIAVTNAKLFPNAGAFNATLGAVAGVYNFDTSAHTTMLAFNIQNLSISLSNAVTLQCGNVTITPGAANILTVPVATLTTSLFSGMAAAQVHNLVFTQTGFSIGSAVLIQGSSVTDNYSAASLTSATTTLTLGQTPQQNGNSITVLVTDGSGTTTLDPVQSVNGKIITLQNQIAAGSTVNVTYAVSSAVPVSIGNFLQVTGASLTLSNFVVNTALAAGHQVTGTLTLGGTVSLFPGSSGSPVSMSGTVNATIDFSTAASTTFTIGVTNFKLTVAGLLEVDAATITITPSDTTLATIDSASVKILPLGLTGTLTSLAITQSGFTIGSVGFNLTGGTNVSLGGVLNVSNPTLSFVNVAYTVGGSLTGTLHFSATAASLDLGVASAVISHNAALPGTEALSGDYDIASRTLQLSLQQVNVALPLITVSATGMSLFYQATGTNSKLLLGATGVAITAGSTSGGPQLAISNATLALAVFHGTATTYALDANGALAINGLPAGISFSAGNVEARINNTGLPVNETINVNGTLLPLVFGASETISATNISVAGSNTSLKMANVPVDTTKLAVNVIINGVSTTLDSSTYTVGTVNGATVITLQNYTLPAGATVVVGYLSGDTSQGNVSQVLVTGAALQIGSGLAVTGNFSFTQSGGVLLIGATNVAASIGDSTMGVSLTGGTLGLEITQSGYALDASGAVSIYGFGSALQFTVTSADLQVNTTGAAVTNLSIPTPGSPVVLNLQPNGTVAFSAKGVTLNIAGFAVVQGDFTFSQIATAGVGGATSTEIEVGATVTTAFLGANFGTASQVGVLLTGGQLGLVLFRSPGAQPTYALVASAASFSLVGVPGLTLTTDGSVNGSGLSIRINTTGQAVNFTASANAALPVDVVFTNGTNGTVDQRQIMDVEGHVKLVVNDPNNPSSVFAQLTGDFAFSKSVNPTTGASKLLVGAANVNLAVNISAASLGISNGTLALAVFTSGGTNPTSTYALDLSGQASLTIGSGGNGISLATSNTGRLELRINNTGTTVNETINVNGTPVALVFAGSVVTDTLTLSGSTSQFQLSQTPGDLGSINVTATEAVTDPTFTASGATTYTLQQTVASGSTPTITYASGGPTSTLTLGTDFTVSKNSSGQTVITFINNPPIGSTVTVSYNAVVNLAGQFTYSVVAGKPTLQFTNPLPAGAVLQVSYVVGETNITQFSATGLTLQVGTFATISGNFVFRKTGTGTASVLEIGANNINVSIGASSGANFTGLSVVGASLGLVVYNDGYALLVNGGVDSLVGIPDLTVTASGLQVMAITTTQTVQNYQITIPGSDTPITLNFTQGAPFFEALGHITLGVANLGSVSGDFGVQKVSDGGTGSYLALGVNNVNVVLGTSDTNFTIAGASLGILIHTAGGTTTYAMVTSGGTDTLNGVPGLTFTGSLSLLFNNGVNTTAANIPTTIQTASGAVNLNFSSLGTGTHGMSIQGTASLDIAGFFTINNGSFIIQKSNVGTTKIILLAIAVPSATMGSAAFGLQFTNVQFGLVVYRDPAASGSTYALTASIGAVTVNGLPAGTTLSGSASLMINTTGKAVNETVTLPNTSVVNLKFTDGTNGTPDQRNIKSFGGSLTFVVSDGSDLAFSLSGSFSFSRTVTGTLTETIIGAANVTGMVNGGSVANVSITNGQLGLVIFSDSSKPAADLSNGYALFVSAKANVSIAGGAVGASAVLTVQRNSTTRTVNVSVSVGGAVVPVTFSATQVFNGPNNPGVAYTNLAVSNGSLTIANLITLTAGNITTTGNTYTATNATITFNDPTSPTQALFTISAGSVTYTSGASWNLTITNASLSLGGFIVISAGTLVVTPDATTPGLTHIHINSGTLALYYNSTLYVSITTSFNFHFGGTDGFAIDGGASSILTNVTDFQILPGLTGG